MKLYEGTIVEESLNDNRMLNSIKIKSIQISKNPIPSKRWHLYNVLVSQNDIKKISENLKSSKWYAHFWKGKNIIVVFKNRTFEINYTNKKTWTDAIKYGLSKGILREQLDFPILRK